MTGKAMMNIAREAMRAIDGRLAEHQERVAYILYKLMLHGGCRNEDSLRQFTMLALLHDVGALKTGQVGSLFGLDFKDSLPHSVYGYLYLRTLTPLGRGAEILLYHHLSWAEAGELDIPNKAMCQKLIVADAAELLLRNVGRGERATRRYRAHRMGEEGYALFMQANRAYGITDALASGAYRAELDELLGRLRWSEASVNRLLGVMVFLLDSRHEAGMTRTISTHVLACELAGMQGLDDDATRALHDASLLYDLGMLALPEEATRHTGPLTLAQRRLVRRHVDVLSDIIQPFVGEEVYRIAAAHHERPDGGGYPGAEGGSLNRAQRILAVADRVAAMNTPRPDRPALAAGAIVAELQNEGRAGRLCPTAAGLAATHYDSLMGSVRRQLEVFEQGYTSIKSHYRTVLERVRPPRLISYW